MSTLLVFGYVWPEPQSSAAGWRMLSLLHMFIEQGYQVHFACAAEQSPHAVDLASLGMTVHKVTINDSAIESWLTQLAPDVVMFDRFMLEEQFGWRVRQCCPAAMQILDSEDLHFLRAARQQRWKTELTTASPSTVAVLAVRGSALYTELAAREIAAMYRVDLTLTISTAEMDILQHDFNFPAAQLCYCPFLVASPTTDIPAAAKVSGDLVPYEERQHFVFIGNFRHEPNWQAVLWLQKIWPKIRAQLPAAQLHIYGAYPPPKLTALANNRQGFYIKGWADDAKGVLSQARVLLAPLPFGAGLKGKLIEAWQVGTPVVTTSIGAEGLIASDRLTASADVASNPISMMFPTLFAGVIADDTEALIDAAVRLYSDAKMWHHAAAHCSSMLEPLNAQQQQARIWQHIVAVQQQLPRHRQQNFTGQMLQLHHMRSTQYMAQWIEVKQQLAELRHQQC
jgi:glycosyltransferase involved in cell wall biosynthesis